MKETRQQRRAREREELKAALHPRVAAARSVQDMFRLYYDTRFAPHLKGIPDAEPIMREAFFAGASGMFDLVYRVSDASVTEDAGVAMMERLQNELQAYAKGPGVQ